MKASRYLMPLTMGICLLGLSGCMTVGPDYQRPKMNMGATFKEAQGWKQASPQDAVNKGDWWSIYNDSVLNGLVGQVQISNQNVAQYEAQYRQALATARSARANLYPTLDLDASGTRRSANSGSGYSSGSSSSGYSNNASRGGHVDTANAQLDASWELDLWGKLRRTDEEERANAQASKADLDNATLSAQTSLVQDYFDLRILDRRIALYEETINTYQRYVQVTTNLYNHGQVTRSDVAQAQASLDSATSSRLDLVWQRAQLEHAIAILIGRPPSEFNLPAVDNFTPDLPDIPVVVPSSLLERRPDIAAAERSVAAANAAVGVAIAGYFPDLTLSASGGYSDTGVSKLFSIANRFWSLGPSLTLPLFEGGANRAAVAQARAAYDASVASYRQTVLEALGDVEDNLVQLRTLDDEITSARSAANNYAESARITYNQYRAGMINYLDVATTQASSLSQQQNVLSLLGQQLTASAALVAALGGGWETSRLDEAPVYGSSPRIKQE